MNENNSKVSMYEAVPVVSELNKVSGFDPLKYLRKTKNGWNLDMKIKKLWFRLKYPAGRTRMVTVKITDQLAIMEAVSISIRMTRSRLPTLPHRGKASQHPAVYTLKRRSTKQWMKP